MFDKDQFVADCQAALAGPQAATAVRELVARAVSEPAAVKRGLGEPKPGGIDLLHRSPHLTIVNLIWPANAIIMPHDHRMWAVIGIYDGREDNILWRRLPDRADGRIEAAGAKSISTGEAVSFGADVIHSVVNPIARSTGALHVYGGDLFGIQRSEWDPESLDERPYDTDKARRMFKRS